MRSAQERNEELPRIRARIILTYFYEEHNNSGFLLHQLQMPGISCCDSIDPDFPSPP